MKTAQVRIPARDIVQTPSGVTWFMGLNSAGSAVFHRYDAGITPRELFPGIAPLLVCEYDKIPGLAGDAMPTAESVREERLSSWESFYWVSIEVDDSGAIVHTSAKKDGHRLSF